MAMLSFEVRCGSVRVASDPASTATGSDNFLEVMTTRPEAGCVTEPLKRVLGAQVRDLRLARHLSQEGLAEDFGVSTRYFAGIERGERNLTLELVGSLAEYLAVEARSPVVRR